MVIERRANDWRALELLAKDLFEPTSARRLHAAHRHKYLHLLALAAAGAGAQFAPTRDTLDTAQQVCVRGPLAAHERGEARAALRAAVALPVGALAVLVWLEAQWGERTFFTVSYDAELFGELLALLIEAAERHPLQHARVLRVLASPATLRAGLDLDALVALELKRHATDAAAGLILQGRCSLAALAAVRSWLGMLDHSLVRRFLDRIVSAIAPPFSSAFVRAFASFCADEASLLALRGASLHTVELMMRFVERAGRTHAAALAPLRDTLTPLYAALQADEARKRK
jgi:hypothetical protein